MPNARFRSTLSDRTLSDRTLSDRTLRLATLRAAARSRSGVLASRRGMSLVEIMVVIAIIGVLMTVIAVNVLGAMDGANQSATEIQIKKMEEALTFYAAKHKGKFPTTSEGLIAAKKYFPDEEVPTDAWGNEFLYFSPGTHGNNQYEIISLGKDGKEGGTDYDVDITSYTTLANDAMTPTRRDRARARRGARRVRSGISLIEIMVVIAIMAVVMGIGIPSLSAIFDLQQRGAARELAMTYSFLVNEAAMRNVTFRIAYNLDAGTYKIEVGDPNTLVFSDPESRARFEADRERELKKFTKKEAAEAANGEGDASNRFSGLNSPGFASQVELPSNSMFAYVYTPQYDEPQTPSEDPPANAADQKIVYSYVFANGVSEHTVVRIVSIDNPEDGYTVEVEPLSGRVSVENEATDIGARMAWLPTEAPSYR